MTLKVWCYEDAHSWGSSVFDAGLRRGWDVRCFDSARTPDKGVIFMHMNSHPAIREHHKKIMQHFATMPGLRLWPDYDAAMLYDDKIEQLRRMARYMPPTQLFRSPLAARDYLDSQPELPMISKSSEGSGVRTLRTYDDCHQEIKRAFSDLGLKNRHGQRSHGYLYWQKHVGQDDSVMRVVCIGDQRLFLKRGPREQGQRVLTPVKTMTDEAVGALALSDRICKDMGFKLCALDCINDAGTWRLLKVIVGWSVRKYFECTFIPDGRDGTAVWEVICDQIEAEALRG